jgi:hypothetical protein
LAVELRCPLERITVTEDGARAFFDLVGARHASNVLQDLPNYLPFLIRHPAVVRARIREFTGYFAPGLRQNVPFALRTLVIIAEAVPEARSQIAQDLGLALRGEMDLLPHHANAGELEQLQRLLGGALSAGEGVALARSMVVLRQPAILVVGAGMSYDRMPITDELTPLLAKFLSARGERDPMGLIARDEQRVWAQVREAPDTFQTLFAGRATATTPAPQHHIAAELLHDGYLSHIVSFNWDDLIERAWISKYEEVLPVIRRDGVVPRGPSLWKQHGDVADFRERWVFPGEAGRVFRSLVESLEESFQNPNPPSHAVVVGYREAEAVVQEQLISRLERRVAIIRVRPGIAPGEGRVASGAREFLEALRLDIESQRRGVG